MKVPKYIRKKMHQIALYAGMASNLDREVGLWLERNGIDVEKLSDGGGSGYEELGYGNDITDELCARIEQMEAYPDIGAPNWEIIVAAAAEQIAGAGLILWTCREGEMLENALEACARWGLHFDAVNDSLPSWKKFYGNETRKVGATEYWDDKAYRVQNGKLMKEAAHEMD